MSIGIAGPRLDDEIERHISTASQRGLDRVIGGSSPTSTDKQPLFIKFTSAKFGGLHAHGGPWGKPPGGLYVSAAPGFTWGRACYVTPLRFPVSTAIFGRCGIVAKGNPAGWRLFDATDVFAQDLYMAWASVQPYARLLMLTTHSAVANQFLRDRFRTQYRIDCVVFPPDETNRHYTRRRTDRWLAVSEWRGGQLVGDTLSTRFSEPRLAAVLAEEFEPVHHALGRRSLIGPMKLPIDHAKLSADIAAAYNGRQIATVTA